MINLLLIFCGALGVSLVLTRAARWTARRLRFVDQPDGERKLQTSAVPVGGGVAVFATFVIVTLCIVGQWGGELLSALAWPLLAAAGCLCLLGAVDDKRNLNGRLKFLLQIASVAPLLASGFLIDDVLLFGYQLHLGWLGVPLTLLWLLTCINAVNLLDGMDGMASVVGIFGGLAVAALASLSGHGHIAMLAVALAGAISGFLRFNVPPATIYLGDSGSTTIGLLLGVLGIQGVLAPSGALPFAATAVTLTVPILDTTLAVVRRTLTGKRLICADRGHIHHRFLECGLSQWQALGVTASICLTVSAAAIVAVLMRSDVPAVLTALLLVAALVQFRLFGQYEISLVRFSAAAVLAHVASRLYRSPSTAATQLEQLSFEAAWKSCVDEISRHHAQQLHMWLRRADGSETWHSWNHESLGDADSTQWTLALNVQQPGGARCELVVGGADSLATRASHLMPLADLLNRFGRHWAGAAHAVPDAPPQQPDDTRDVIPMRRAA